MHTPLRLLPLLLCLLFVLAEPAVAQADVGCCQFSSPTTTGGRRCDNLNKDECLLSRPVSTFFRGLQCNFNSHRCVRNAPPAGTPVPTMTPSPLQVPVSTATPTRTPTALVGCCEVENMSGLSHPVCGNAVSQTSCVTDFAGTFCRDCACSSHSGPGFDFTSGMCTARTPAPTAIATPTVGPLGCCQLDHLHRAPYPVCGNAISASSCLNDYAGTPTFCADCACTSHTEPGFEFTSGECLQRTPTPTATPVAGPRRGCCQLESSRGLAHPICGNAILESDCTSDIGTQPTFCADCTCSSHTTAGYTFDRGACSRPRPNPHAPHRPHPPH